MGAPVDFILYTERMVGEDSPDYDDTLNRALKTVIDLSGADEDDFVGFALRPTVAPSVGQFYVATDIDVGASWQTLVTSMITDIASASTGITKVGTVNTGAWQGTSIATTYTDAKVKTVTGTANRLTIGGTATDPTFDISSSYVGQATITTLGTIVTGVWTGTSVGTAYTDAKIVSITGTSNRLTVAGTATIPILDISAAYVGQTSIVTLGTVTTGSWTATSIATTYTDAKVVSITGTSSRVTVGGTATVPVIDISASYVGQSSLTTLGTITTGAWHGTSIDTAYTDAKIKTVTGTSNRLTVGGTATDPTFDVSVSYVGQATITTLGTVTVGSWTATSISTTYTDAKVKTVTGTANRLTVGGTAADPTFDISTSYVGQATITTLGTVVTGTWAATVVGVPYGGTGLATYTIGDIVYASGATTISKLAIGTAAQILIVNGGATAPAWHTLVTADITDLTSATTGITKVGTVTTGVWNAGIINGIYGGTGVNNGASTITLAGNLVTSGAFALTLTTTNTTNVTLPTTGTLVNTAVTSLASLTSVGGAFAISGAFTGATTGAFSSTLSTSQLTITDTASRIIPGATSLSLRNNANNADNILISDAGAITVRSTIGGVTTISGTTATFTNLGGTLTTAAQTAITSTGVLASLHATSLVIDSGGLTITGAATITGGAGNMTILSGTGVSRTMIFQTTTSGSVATTALTLGADQIATFAAGIVGGSTTDITINTNKFTVAASSGNTSVAGTLGVTGVATFTAQSIHNGGIDLNTHAIVNGTSITLSTSILGSPAATLGATTATTLVLSSAASPALHLTGATAQAILLDGSTTGASYIQHANNGGGALYGMNSLAGTVITNGTTYSAFFVSTSTNNLELGTSATVRLTINGSSGLLKASAYGAGTATFDASGNITSVSDARDKDVVGTFTRGLNAIRGLVPKAYHWNEKSGLSRSELNVGFIAQEVEPWLPEAVFYNEERDRYSFSDRAVIAALVNAVNELDKRIMALA